MSDIPVHDHPWDPHIVTFTGQYSESFCRVKGSSVNDAVTLFTSKAYKLLSQNS